MAGVRFRATTDPTAVGTSGEKTILQIVAAANHAVLINRIKIAFDGVSGTQQQPRVEVSRQTTAGTSSGGGSSLIKDPDDAAETLQVSLNDTYTVEPTKGDVLENQPVHPQTTHEFFYRRGDEIKIGGGDRLGIIVDNDSGSAVNATVTVYGEE